MPEKVFAHFLLSCCPFCYWFIRAPYIMYYSFSKYMYWESDYPVCDLLVTCCVFWWVKVFNFAEMQLMLYVFSLRNPKPHSCCNCFLLWTFKFSFYIESVIYFELFFCIVIVCIMWGINHNSIHPIQIFNWSNISCLKAFSSPLNYTGAFVKNYLYWVGQKVFSGFSTAGYGKTRMNCLTTPIHV